MKDEIKDILKDILRRGDDVLGTTPETDLNYLFLHTLVNYAKAKQESEGSPLTVQWLPRFGRA